MTIQQYIVRPSDGRGIDAASSSDINSRRISIASDPGYPLRTVLPANLDLPQGVVPPRLVERSLKLFALFWDAIVIPDGWLHCSGPLSEYLRFKLRRSPRGEKDPEFTGNLLFQLLRSGTAIPALRGRRSQLLNEEPLGFDLHDTWQGRDGYGRTLDLGVRFDDPAERMTVLDPTEENHILLDSISRNTRTFVDWGSPHISVLCLDGHHENVRRSWDSELGSRAAEVLNEPGGIFTQDHFSELVRERLAPDSRENRQAWKAIELVADGLAAQRDVRRGVYEREVAKALQFQRLASYRDLHSYIACPPGDEESRLGMLGLLLLYRISTIQQGMFAQKFVASPFVPSTCSVDVFCGSWPDFAKVRYQVTAFNQIEYAIRTAPIYLDRLNGEQIHELRGSPQALRFFEELRTGIVTPDALAEHGPLAGALGEYLTLIAEQSALHPVADMVLRGIEEYSVRTVLAASGGGLAEFLWPGVGPIVSLVGLHIAGSTARGVVAKVHPEVQAAIDKLLAQKRADAALQVLRTRMDTLMPKQIQK